MVLMVRKWAAERLFWPSPSDLGLRSGQRCGSDEAATAHIIAPWPSLHHGHPQAMSSKDGFLIYIN